MTSRRRPVQPRGRGRWWDPARAWGGTLALLLPALLLPGWARAQGIDLSHGGPVSVTARDGIDWDQNNQLVIARGDARAIRGDVTVTADVLTAHYRKKAGATKPVGSGAAAGATPAAVVATDVKPGSGIGDDTGANEIYRLEATGHVHIFTPTDQAWGDHATYDIDQAVLVLVGGDLKLVTPTDVLTARDAMEYWSARHMSVGRGDAVVTTNDSRRVQADVLVGYSVDPVAAAGSAKVAAGPGPAKAGAAKGTGDPVAASSSKLQRVDAFGHVRVQTPTEVVTGERGVYVPDTEIARIVGAVHITRGENQMNGSAAIVNMRSGLATLSQDPGSRVEGLIVPNSQTPGASPGTTGAAPGAGPSVMPGSKGGPPAGTKAGRAGAAAGGAT